MINIIHQLWLRIMGEEPTSMNISYTNYKSLWLDSSYTTATTDWKGVPDVPDGTRVLSLEIPFRNGRSWRLPMINLPTGRRRQDATSTMVSLVI